ncbi:hypothetical protein [Bacillus cereus]|uniref:hypothetical protein n=1 Tax=Bacillus cereus TaxID=1396 RepID=UPI000BF6A2C9|nr:hypothetical protein [Bacillus cereus]PFI78869.1 hypothetical protein COI83_26385 [Bacillus cereus]
MDAGKDRVQDSLFILKSLGTCTSKKEQLAKANYSNQGCNSRCIYIIDGMLSFIRKNKKSACARALLSEALNYYLLLMCVSHEQTNSSKSKDRDIICEIKKRVDKNKKEHLRTALFLGVYNAWSFMMVSQR